MTNTFEADRERMLATIDRHWGSKANREGRMWAYAENWFPYERARWLNEVVLDSGVFDLREQMSSWEEEGGNQRVGALTLKGGYFDFTEVRGHLSVWERPEVHEPALRVAITPLIDAIRAIQRQAAVYGGRLAPFLPVYPKLPVGPNVERPKLSLSSVFGIRGMDQEIAYKIVLNESKR